MFRPIEYVEYFAKAYRTRCAHFIFGNGYYNEFKDAKYGMWKKKASIVGWKSFFYGFPIID